MEILLFEASWCGPCGQQKEIMDEFESDNPSIDVTHIDIDEDMETANEYSVRSVPTIVIKKDGEVSEQFSGLTQREAIDSAV